MAKQLIFGEEARSAMKRGIDIMADIPASAAKVQHGGRGNGHLWRYMGKGIQKPEILQHGMIFRKTNLARNHDTIGLGLHAMKLDTAFPVGQFHPVESREKIEMPVGPADFAVGDCVQTDSLLLFHHIANAFILYRPQLRRADVAIVSILTRLFDGCRS